MQSQDLCFRIVGMDTAGFIVFHFLECICPDSKSLPMCSLLVRHFYWIGCTTNHTSLSLSIPLSVWHLLVVFYVIQGLNPCK